VPKQRVLFQDQDPCFYGMLFWGGHVLVARKVLPFSRRKCQAGFS
jgi:hypothetical protein